MQDCMVDGNRLLMGVALCLLASPSLSGCAVISVVSATGSAASAGIGAATTVGSIALSGAGAVASGTVTGVRALTSPSQDRP